MLITRKDYFEIEKSDLEVLSNINKTQKLQLIQANVFKSEMTLGALFNFDFIIKNIF